MMNKKLLGIEILSLGVIIFLLYQINILQKEIITTSNERISVLLNSHKVFHQERDLSALVRNYIVTGDKDFYFQYQNILKNGYGIVDTIKQKALYQKLTSLSLNQNEKNLIENVIKNIQKLQMLNQEALGLFKFNHKKDAFNIVFSPTYKKIENQTLLDMKNLITRVNFDLRNRLNNLNNQINLYFKLLIIISLIFVIVNIYIYISIQKFAKREIYNQKQLLKEIEHFNDTLEEEVEKRTKEIKDLMRIKSEFLANMSHEIRTPLNAMFGFIRLLQEKDLDEESNKYLNVIEKSGQNLLTIINDILDFSKIEAGKLNIEKVEFNPKEEIEVIYSLFQGMASEKNITLEINCNLDYNIVSDPVRIKQVIANLLSNAIKFSKPNSKVILNINYNSQTQKLYVEVIDEGIGIPKDKQKSIFEAFSQADNSTTRKYGGTGLGLAISHKLIELLGGELKVKSDENKGSIFYFSIPAIATSKIKSSKPKKKEKIDNQKFDGYVLLVEDNKANQLFMKVMLEKMGFNVDFAENGKEAVEKFKEFKYDLILMDENMPIMNGIEATKQIRQIEKEKNLEHTPIIALTANAMEGDKERFISAGMDYYLSKPLDIEKLKAILQKL